MALDAGNFDRELPELRLNSIAEVLWSHRWKIVIWFVIVMVLDVAYTLFCPRSYRSEGKLFVHFGRENSTPDPVAGLGVPASSAATTNSREYEINSVTELLGSRWLIEKVVDAFGPDVILDESSSKSKQAAEKPDRAASTPSAEATVFPKPDSWFVPHSPLASLSPREKAIRLASKRLDIQSVRNSDIIVVVYQASSPQLAAAVVAKVMEIYRDENVRLNRPRGTFQFLAKQKSDLQMRLANMEQELCELKNEMQTANPQARGKEIADQIAEVEKSLLLTDAGIAAVTAERERLRATLTGLSPTQIATESTGLEDKAVAAMREHLFDLQLKERSLLASTKTDYFEVAQLRKQIAEGTAILESQNPSRVEVTRAPNRAYEEIQLSLFRQEALLAADKAKADTLRGQLVTLRTALTSFNAKDLLANRLQREIELCTSNYRTQATNLEQARIDEAMQNDQIACITIAQPATLEFKPSHPRLLINAVFGLLLGMFGGGGLAFLAEMRGDAKQA